MRNRFNSFGIVISLAVLSFYSNGCAQEIELYPKKYNTLPDIASPTKLKNGTEVIISLYVIGGYSILPVTQEKGEIYSCLYDFNGKGDQVWIDEPDFHSLGKTGLHSEDELNKKTMISGRSIEVINFISRPNRFSHSGFMAEDEDIISVLKGDNRIVKRMGLVHSQMAKPMFHIWNAILANYFEEKDTATIYYNSNIVRFNREWCNGYQESIFHDEIEGRHNIHIWRELSKEEIKYLTVKYNKLTESQLKILIEMLTHLHVSEMTPFYIMRYGFYEGHTSYRADPIAIAFVFGLKSIKDIDVSFNNDLFNILNQHFTGNYSLSN
jgi:hypothetical protein